MTLPIIRFEIESMKHSLSAMLNEYSVQIDEDIKAAVEEFCKPENIKKEIFRITYQTLSTAINQEINNFYLKGDGRFVIAEQVKKALLNNETYTALDMSNANTN